MNLKTTLVFLAYIFVLWFTANILSILSDIPSPALSQTLFKKIVYDSTFTYSLVIKTGRGCAIEDVDGMKFLDFTSNIGSCPLGYSHPEILEVIKEYSSIEKGVHKIAGQDFY